ncbi:MAG: tRNA uridine-5-carboxymethylaminomethyl(34) synthesis GTPase MnmE [Brevinemataceae bacterium]
MNHKIIAAPATAAGFAGVSMIRVSGEGCIKLVDHIFRGKVSLSEKKAYEIAYGSIIDPSSAKIIDEVLVGIFQSPYSFTGEESLEIWTHGSPYIVKEVLRLLYELGITGAEPGEFSFRAFLNGKMDLTQAEAVRDLIHAQTKFAHAQAIGRLNGGLTSKIEDLHHQILDILALLETAIDHAEEEVDILIHDQYEDDINHVIRNIEQLLSGASVGKMSNAGIKIALSGRPNVGKSSLLNALSCEDRVIVSDIAGTTRDVVEHSISSHGLLLRFFDTAGIRETDDIIEKQGTVRSWKALEQADIVLFVLDQSQDVEQDDLEILKRLEQIGKYTIVILNKRDLPSKINIESSFKTLSVSARTGEGLDEIFQKISDFYHSGCIDPENEILIANARQEGLLIQAKSHLLKALESIGNEQSEEFTASHIRDARASIEEIVGKTTDDAILDRIFSQFCIGK